MRTAQKMFGLGKDNTTTKSDKEVMVNFEYDNRTYSFKVSQNEDLESVKAKLQDKTGMSPEHMQFQGSNGKDINNFYNVKQGTTFFVTSNLSGGCMFGNTENQHFEGEKARQGCCCGIPCSLTL
jgi:hypothetical protein